MRVFRCYTKENRSPYSAIAFQTANSEIRNPDGSIVFSASNIKVPKDWSQVAIDVLAQKYFRKAGNHHRAECRKCEGELSWERDIYKDFGITADQYYQVLNILDGKCMLCRTKGSMGQRKAKHYPVDHQEKPWLLRGILCFKCNTGLGILD